jgi:plastocyanin
MRRSVLLLFFSLAAAAVVGCSDDGPGGLTPDETYTIETSTPTLSIRQDLTAQTFITIRRGAADTIYFPRADTVVVGATGFDPDSLNVATGATVVFRNDPPTAHRINFHSTAITDIPGTTGGTFTAGDSTRTFPSVGTFRYNCTVHPADTGVVIVHPRTRVTYTSEDYTIAGVDSLGRVTGLRGGTTNIRVMANGATLSIPVTVDPYPATEVSLTFMDGASEGTFFAMPGDANSSVLNAIVRVQQVDEFGVISYDTVFCNRCDRVTTRTQRVVQFISTDTLKARVSNARNALSPDTAGKVLPLDTTRTGEPLRIILSVPGDNKADTVLVNLRLRPIDSLLVRPDSFVNPATGRKQAFLTTVTPDSVELNLGVTLRAMVRDAPAIPGGTPGSPRWIAITTTGGQRRTALPPVTWESANPNFATITADGRVFGVRSNAESASQVLTCTNTPTIPAAFPGEGTLTVPNCVPTRIIDPRPGAWCNTASTTAVDAFCEVWMRATIVDPVTGAIRTDKVAVIITR